MTFSNDLRYKNKSLKLAEGINYFFYIGSKDLETHLIVKKKLLTENNIFI